MTLMKLLVNILRKNYLKAFNNKLLKIREIKVKSVLKFLGQLKAAIILGVSLGFRLFKGITILAPITPPRTE